MPSAVSRSTRSSAATRIWLRRAARIRLRREPFVLGSSTVARTNTVSLHEFGRISRHPREMPEPVSQKELLSKVRDLRGRGLSPKQVARELGMRPAEVAPLIRQVAGSHRLAAAERELPEPADRDLIGCWVNPGWSSGLILDDSLQELPEDPKGGDDLGSAGLVGVMIARGDRSSRVTLSGFLLDVYCLGVKNTIGPLTVGSSAVTSRVNVFFNSFDCAPRSAPLVLAQHLVHGSVAYARALGFEPHPEFADTAPYLGTASGPCPITFGRAGKPFYISGPRDDQHAVLATLAANAGTGTYDYLAHL
jgi:hypothetical protein